ncbi:enoyl-CoA hydratase/isomerase family protein [Anaerococcus cruorum]|uniref:3-hydroxyisobutyryl-CoA hydrolase n=1 Tax=Anaerococcus cruorum TaxID=3115617 RepID=A0ABW9MVT3_9FIRM
MIEEKVINKVGIIYLNRPEKLNAINLAMVERIYSILKKWEDDENIKVILFDSLVKKGFSAGGDLKEIYTNYLVNDNCKDKSYLFKKEYELDAYINSYKKPIISHWQGIVMGGGVGLTINSDLIICEPNVKWAMPETSLGFVPDVGVGKYISKLPQALGQYVGLCGVSLSSSDLVKYKLADVAIKENSYQILLEKLYALSTIFSGDDLINEFKIEASKFEMKENDSVLQKNLSKINKYFSYDSMEEIYNNLKVNLDDDFALNCYQNLSKKDPFILTIQFEKYFVGKNLTYNQTLDLDLKIVQYAIKTKSIHEGIRAKIIDKDNNPNWPHKSFQEVSINEVKDLLLS